MMRAMIIDDEPLIRQSLKKLLERNKANLTVVGEAGNGVEALRQLEHTKVDILFLDIRMPLMDGFDCLHRLSAMGKTFKTIILTAYRDFDYAAKAIEYGAFGYLLKPINERKLMDMVAKVGDKINQEHRDEQARAQLLHLQRSRSLAALLEGEERDVSESDTLIWPEPMENTPHRLIVVQSATPRALQLRRLDQHDFFYYKNEIVLFQNALDPLLKAPLAAMTDSPDTWYGVSLPFTGHNLIGTAYEQAKAALFYRYPSAVPHVYCYKRPEALAGEALHVDVPTVDQRQASQLADMLELGLIDEARALIQRLTNHWSRSGFLGMNHMYKAYFQWIEAIRGVSSQLRMTDAGRTRLNEITLDRVRSVTTVDAMTSLFEELFASLSPRPAMDDSDRMVHKIQTYIQNNYQQDISLQGLAGELYLSKNYISAVFKQKTGVNYHDYLTKIRMERAKAILTETEKSIGLIATEIGYKNTSHFCKVFKQAVGVSPAEYRQLKFLSS